MEPKERSLGMPELRRLQQLIGRLNGFSTLTETLQSVVDGVVEMVGFEVAAVSHVHGDGTFETVAVAGDDEARAQLLGSRRPASTYDEEFELADRWGTLWFVPHERLPHRHDDDPDGVGAGWVPDVAVGDGPDAWHPLDALFAPLRSPSGELVGMLSVDLPADRRRPGPFQRELLEMFAAQAGIAVDNARLTERLRASEEVFRLAFEGAGAGLALISLAQPDAGRYVRVNPAFCRLVGYSAEQLLTMSFRDITHPDHVDDDDAAVAAALGGSTGVYVTEKRYVHASGVEVWVAVTTSLVREADGTPVVAISQVEDVSARRAAREELAHQASHDALTGLPNRHALQSQLAAAAEVARTTGRPGAVLFCDLDGFKAVNDVHGHAVGDQVLVQVAARLQVAIRGQDSVARYGGDEFVVVARDVSAQEADQLAERLHEAVRSPVLAQGLSLSLSASVGVAVLATDSDPEQVLRQADALMYRAKLAARVP